MSYYENLRFVADYYGLDPQIKKLVDNFRRAEDVVVLDEESMEQARAAAHFGVEAQVCKTVEEAGEFLAELGRTMNGLTEEIADVYNMLDQLCYLFGIEDDVQGAAERKMERTIQRMEAGETDEAVQDIHG